MILAADIGGTNTRLGLFEQRGSDLYLIKQKKLASKDWQDLVPVLLDFLGNAGFNAVEIDTGCLSLAGPIHGDHCQLTNLNKNIDLKHIQKVLNTVRPLSFCNDLVALGYGLNFLKSSQLHSLTSSPPSFPPTLSATYNRAILAPGTGLGESLIIGEYVIPTEGAHTDFAPRSEIEVRLWRFLHHQWEHVSYERILSGPGLLNLYSFFLNETGQQGDYSPSLSPEDITRKALNKGCPACESALNLFLEILGAEAGNVALRALAYGGIYLGGGIVPKLLPLLHEEKFLEAFCNKGRFKELLKSIPIFVILEEETALYGAARFALNSSQHNTGLQKYSLHFSEREPHDRD